MSFTSAEIFAFERRQVFWAKNLEDSVSYLIDSIPPNTRSVKLITKMTASCNVGRKLVIGGESSDLLFASVVSLLNLPSSVVVTRYMDPPGVNMRKVNSLYEASCEFLGDCTGDCKVDIKISVSCVSDDRIYSPVIRIFDDPAMHIVQSRITEHITRMMSQKRTSIREAAIEQKDSSVFVDKNGVVYDVKKTDKLTSDGSLYIYEGISRTDQKVIKMVMFCGDFVSVGYYDRMTMPVVLF
jgi:hypothetical protein